MEELVLECVFCLVYVYVYVCVCICNLTICSSESLVDLLEAIKGQGRGDLAHPHEEPEVGQHDARADDEEDVDALVVVEQRQCEVPCQIFTF